MAAWLPIVALLSALKGYLLAPYVGGALSGG